MITMCTNCGALNNIPENKLSNNPNCGKCKNPLYQGKPISMNGAQLTRAIDKTDELLVVDFGQRGVVRANSLHPLLNKQLVSLNLKHVSLKLKPKLNKPFLPNTVFAQSQL